MKDSYAQRTRAFESYLLLSRWTLSGGAPPPVRRVQLTSNSLSGAAPLVGDAFRSVSDRLPLALRELGLRQSVIVSSRRPRHVEPAKAAKLADTRKDVLVAPELTGHFVSSLSGAAWQRRKVESDMAPARAGMAYHAHVARVAGWGIRPPLILREPRLRQSAKNERRLRHKKPAKAAKLADTRKDVLVAPELTGHFISNSLSGAAWLSAA